MAYYLPGSLRHLYQEKSPHSPAGPLCIRHQVMKPFIVTVQPDLGVILPLAKLHESLPVSTTGKKKHIHEKGSQVVPPGIRPKDSPTVADSALELTGLSYASRKASGQLFIAKGAQGSLYGRKGIQLTCPTGLSVRAWVFLVF